MRTSLKQSFLIVLTLACLFTPQLLRSQTPANPWAQVQVDATLPGYRQRNPVIQARLQQWFMGKIQTYQHVLDDTAIGKANPKIVNLGDWTTFFHRILAPPTGTGTTTITFGNVGAPSTMDDTAEIIFPQGSANNFINGSPDTCWHEFQHAIVIISERAGRPVAIPRSPWMMYAKPGDNRNEEHIYMEGLGEYTAQWLDLLLHEQSKITGGAGMGFEKHARAAYEQIKQYQAQGESISYAVENFCWAKAHDAYCRAWTQQGRLVAPLPLQYRQDYQQICGVWIGFVEEIITFYMQGGLKAADGKPIHVPEWVMNPDPMKTGIIVGHLNENKAIQGDTLRYGYDVRVMENYRHKDHSDSLNHGKVQITLGNADADTSLELAVDGKPIKRSGNSGKIDLAGFKIASKIRVTLVRGKLSSFVGVKRYRILVDYQPDPRIENGVQKPPLYYPSKALYYIDVTGGTATAAKPAGASTTTPAGNAKTKPATIPTSPFVQPKAEPGMWKLKEVVKNKRFSNELRQPGLTGNATLNDTSVVLTFSQPVTGPPAKTVTSRSTHSWNHPGTTLAIKTKVPVTITLKSDGDGPHSALEAFTQHKKDNMTYGLFTHPTSGGADHSGGGVSIDQGKTSATRTIQVPIPQGYPDETLTIRLFSMYGPMSVNVEFHYVWEKAGASPPGIADATLTAEEAKPEEMPAGMDNVPPKPGELVKIPQTKETPPPTKPKTPRSLEHWYMHPSGDYKFKLSKGWKLSSKYFFDEKDDGYDTLWPADKGMAVICARAYNLNGAKSDNAVLNEYAAKMLKNNPGAKSTRLKYSETRAVQIADFDKEASVMHWHVAISHKGRCYFISVVIPSPTAPAKMPDPPVWMLGSLVMQR